MPQTKLGKFVVNYLSSEEYHHVKREIWTEQIYQTEISTEISGRAPTIIDVGAHIGLATLYFAYHFPTAHIISLEPNPFTFKILEENIWQNRLENHVTCFNQAIAPQAGKLPFYFNPKATDWQLNSSLYSTTWTNQPLPNSVEVNTITLSSLITQPIDLLKIDVEGGELQLIQEAQHQLTNANQMLIEFHPRPNNELADLLALLKKHEFVYTLWKQDKQVQENQTRGLALVRAKNQLHN